MSSNSATGSSTVAGHPTRPHSQANGYGLSERFVWTRPVVRGGTVQLAPVDYFAPTGFTEWRIIATRLGASTIEARGKANCARHDGSAAVKQFRVCIVIVA